MTREQEAQLNNLKQEVSLKYEQCKKTLDSIYEGYTCLIRQALIRNNFDMRLIELPLRFDISSKAPDDRWRRDYIELRFKEVEGKDYHTFDIYIKANKVEFNNCCCGNWEKGDLYYSYLKALVAIPDISDELLHYSQIIDRSDLLAYDEAWGRQENLEREIRAEEHRLEKEAKMQEIDSAEYITRVTILNEYDFGYEEGKEPKKIIQLFKVMKRTPKYIFLREYTKKQAGFWSPYVWSSALLRKKKEELYNPSYEKVTKETLDIED